MAWVVVAHEGDQGLELHQIGRQPIARCLRWAALQHLAAPLRRVLHPVTDPRGEHRLDRGREQQRREEHRHHRAQDDFFAAGHDGVEDAFRRGDRRKPDERGGVAGQQKRIAARAAIEQRQEQACREPQRHRRAQQQGRFHQIRQHHQGGHAGQQGAEHAVHALGTGGAEQWLRDDVDRGHCPVRSRQIAGQRDIQRRDRGGKGLGRKQPGLAIAQQRNHRAALVWLRPASASQPPPSARNSWIWSCDTCACAVARVMSAVARVRSASRLDRYGVRPP